MVDYLKECLKEPVPREWSFPESEYRARLEKTRKAMDEAGIDVLLVHAIVDNCYLSGYQSLWPEAYACLIVPREGEPFMQVGEIEGSAGRAAGLRDGHRDVFVGWSGRCADTTGTTSRRPGLWESKYWGAVGQY